jgi:hypothetical protein
MRVTRLDASGQDGCVLGAGDSVSPGSQVLDDPGGTISGRNASLLLRREKGYLSSRDKAVLNRPLIYAERFNSVFLYDIASRTRLTAGSLLTARS